MPTAKLITFTPNYMELMGQAAGQCYGNKVGKKGIDRIIKSGHLSVLEHCSASLEIECSVRVLGQITRHRHLSFTVKSTRGSTYGFDDIIIPTNLENYPLHAEKFDMVMTNNIIHYLEAIKDGVPLEDAAYILPQGIKTKMVVSGNFRAWFEYLPKRECKRALPEHRDLAGLIHGELARGIPEVFDRNFMGCKTCTEERCEYK